MQRSVLFFGGGYFLLSAAVCFYSTKMPAGFPRCAEMVLRMLRVAGFLAGIGYSPPSWQMRRHPGAAQTGARSGGNNKPGFFSVSWFLQTRELFCH